MNPEKSPIEHEPTRESPTSVLLDIYKARDKGNVGELQKTLDKAVDELGNLESSESKEKIQENLDWLLDNNNRINLYQIAAVLKGEKYDRADEDMDKTKAKQFFVYRQIQAALVTAGEIEQLESVNLLANFINKNSENTYLCNTAIDSLAKSKVSEVGERINEIVNSEKYDFEIKTRAVLAGLRTGMQFDSNKIFALLNEYIKDLGDQLCQPTGTCNIIEIAGLLEDRTAAATILDELHTRMQKFSLERNQWFERDIISTRLAVKSDDKKDYVDQQLASRQYITPNGIAFGSLNPDFNFADFLIRHQDKFDRISEVITHLNQAFNSEPILYVDISSGDVNEAGWTQNSIYFSSDYIDHSQEVEDLLQSIGHEACERWQSKGFIDVQFSKYYLQLMGQKYEDSELDKFRLKHRLKEESNAGHPWDGEREFIAELGSTLLVDPAVIAKLFDPRTDQTSLEALEYLKTKLNLEK